ncbi:Kelch repeat-containing protein [Devosia sp. CN2-171]|uniref:Kelch repeat-containing protein n=1 Tax=Devosia sp. CN2-171 TaxID=3400909 RepID=UPI003BF79856
MRALLPLALLLLTSPAAVAQSCIPNTWREAAPLPTERTEVTAATDGTATYVAGGMASDPATDLVSVFRYDPAEDVWSVLAALDRDVNHTGLVVLDGKVYVVGGYEAPENRPTARVRAIDIAAGTVTDVAPLPAPRGALVAVVLDAQIHAIGGTTDKSVGTHEVYDPATDSWRAAAPMSVPRNHIAGAALGGKIYVFGGRDEQTFLLDAGEVYDPATDSWAPIAPLPTGRSGIGAAAVDGRIIVFGGEVGGAGGHTFAEVEAYDPATDRWAELAPMPTARHGLGVAAIGDEVFTISGGPQPALTVSGVNEVLCAARQ